MTLTDHRRTPAAPDDQIPAHATSRPAHQVAIGWHVRVADRWLLVADITKNRNTVFLFFADESMCTVGRQSPLWTRTPAEQIAASTWGTR